MKLIYPILATAVLAGCQNLWPDENQANQARANLQAKSGSDVTGVVTFKDQGDKVAVEVQASGLEPNSVHGFHIHEKGDCSAPDASSAGGHFNPDSQPHGYPHSTQSHAGDMLNLKADAQGRANASFELSGLNVGDGSHNILQRSVVIHANADDHQSQPSGNSGARIACGVISKA
jgi:Cu-Zn family superoxide dismutase